MKNPAPMLSMSMTASIIIRASPETKDDVREKRDLKYFGNSSTIMHLL